MSRGITGRLSRLERSLGASTVAGWAAINLPLLTGRVAAAFGLSRAELERELDRPADLTGDDHPAASAYWAGLGDQLRAAGLTFLDLRELADQEAAR